MKTSLNSGSGRALIRAHVTGLLALSLQISIPAQESKTVDSSPTANVTVSAEATTTDTSATGAIQPARLDVSDLVGVAPAPAITTASSPELPFHVPPVVAHYLPKEDTNPSIGVQYPAGSTEFAYLVAGIRPPGGDSRLPVAVPTEPAVAAPPEPLVSYERPEAGSKALMMRTTIPDQTSTLDQTHTFPPGAFVRGAAPVRTVAAPDASLPRPRGVVSYREAAATADGKDVIRDFPPGATLRKSPLPEGGR